MNEIVLANRAPDWRRLKALVLDSVSSPVTKRVYNLGLDEFFAWYGQEAPAGFTRATVSAWRVALEARGLRPVSINVGKSRPAPSMCRWPPSPTSASGSSALARASRRGPR